MISRSALKELLIMYRTINASDEFECILLSGYPHIAKIIIRQEVYYLKELVINKSRREWIERVYLNLESYNHYIHPLKNEHGSFTLAPTGGSDIRFVEKTNEYCYLLTRESGSKEKNPTAGWWARSLANLHNSVFQGDYSVITLKEIESKYDKSLIILPKYSSVMNKLDRMKSIIEQDVVNLIKSIIPDNLDAFVLKQRGCFVHGDPLNSNVLIDNSNFILFDFESSGISVKEYDIQRIFTDIATNCVELNDVDTFVRDFIDSYELIGETINITLLDYIYRLDLIRTIIWLYEVSLSYNRQDYERQLLELEKYKAALRSGFYHRVIAAIHQTWHYSLSDIRINNQDEILKVANIISSIVPDFVCATLGGSRAHFLDDAVSDVEMYFYSKSGVPPIEKIDMVLENVGALHRRSSSFLWNEEPWGPHSFFEIGGLYFEIGYRIIGDIEIKIKDYLLGHTVEPQKDCHDLGLGYLFSGLTASVQAEKIVICNDESFLKLKNLANEFPDSLCKALVKEYLETADNLIKGKLLVAAKRQDAFFYNVLSTRVIRCLMIMAFAVSKMHFPGDKWNEVLLLHTKWSGAKRMLQLLNAHIKMDTSFDEKYRLLVEAYELVNKDIPR